MSRLVAVISLGCSKNLVDSERLMHMLAEAGLKLADPASREWQKASPRQKYVVVNTCGFISDAKEESIEEILGWGQLRTEGKIAGLYVMGCLSERYRDELPAEITEVDRWWGKTDWPGIVSHIAGTDPSARYDRVLTTPPHHAYVKIAEGCNRMCAFCAIPIITGRYKSRPVEEIADEVHTLVGRGVKEFNIIAQDLTSYGIDLYGKVEIARLVDTLAQIEGVERIRLHYAYPNDFPLDLLDVMARHANVCKYLDIALQHVSDKVLSNMRRHITGAETRALLTEIRRRVPGIHIRTTLMVGFPGEGEEEFDELMRFVAEQRFERMGAFAYCEEDDTWAARHLDDNVPDEVKQDRLSRLMALQEEISLEIQQNKVGLTLPVIIDREEDGYYIGRTEFDSPEVDPEVLVEKTRTLAHGEICSVRITGAMPFELTGTPLSEQQ